MALIQFVPPSIYIKETGTAKGLGVFASRTFCLGEVVETCPVLVLKEPFDALPLEIKRRVFNWSVLANIPETSAMAFGYGSLYNHANPANLEYKASEAGDALRFVAARKIEENEELTINYNAYAGVASWHDNNWFERMNVSPIGGE